MSFGGYENAWTVNSPQTGDIVKDAIRKEQLIKDIAAAQEDLKAMMSKIQNTQKEVDKLTSGNETLQMYIDNLTVQMAKSRR